MTNGQVYTLLNPRMVSQNGGNSLTFSGNSPLEASKEAYRYLKKNIKNKKSVMLFTLQNNSTREVVHFKGKNDIAMTGGGVKKTNNSVSVYKKPEKASLDAAGVSELMNKRNQTSQTGGRRKSKSSRKKTRKSSKKRSSRKRKKDSESESESESDSDSDDDNDIYDKIAKQMGKMDGTYTYIYPVDTIYYYDPFVYGDTYYTKYILDNYLLFPHLYLPLSAYDRLYDVYYYCC